MKKIIATITLVLISFSASADYCDGKGQECWNNAMQASMKQVEYYYLSIMKMPINDEYKQDLTKNQREWVNAVNTQCQTARCVCNSAKDRLMFLLGQQQKAIKVISQK